MATDEPALRCPQLILGVPAGVLDKIAALLPPDDRQGRGGHVFRHPHARPPASPPVPPDPLLP